MNILLPFLVIVLVLYAFSSRVVGILFVVSAILLVLYAFHVNAFGFVSFVDRYGGPAPLFLLMLFSGCIVGIEIIKSLWDAWQVWRAKR
jgi:hypothetical protein